MFDASVLCSNYSYQQSIRNQPCPLVFVDGIRSLEDLDTYAKRLGDLPCLYNGQLVPTAEVEARGFRLMIHTATLNVAFQALRDAMLELAQTGSVKSADNTTAFAELIRLLGVPEALAEADKYR